MAAKKQGVNQWWHYRTTDRADGFECREFYNGAHYRAKLYWAPAEFRNPKDGKKRPYLAMRISPSGKMNSFGNYPDEFIHAGYVGEERPRRNWQALCEIAERITTEKLRHECEVAIEAHNDMLAKGYTFENGAYYKNNVA